MYKWRLRKTKNQVNKKSRNAKFERAKLCHNSFQENIAKHSKKQHQFRSPWSLFDSTKFYVSNQFYNTHKLKRNSTHSKSSQYRKSFGEHFANNKKRLIQSLISE